MGRKAMPRDEMGLTVRQHQILHYLTEYQNAKGYPPTVREICRQLDIKSPSTIHKDLKDLEEKNMILRDPSKPRAIELLHTEKPSGARTGSSASSGFGSSLSNVETAHTSVTEIPVVGRVAAGAPILADENITEYFPVPSSYTSGSYEYFMLTVRGESMIEAGIMDGDYILVRQQSEARNGDMVVAMIDGFESEATVKTFYKEKDHIRLQPENHTMSPILVREVRILGLVKGVFRYL